MNFRTAVDPELQIKAALVRLREDLTGPGHDLHWPRGVVGAFDQRQQVLYGYPEIAGYWLRWASNRADVGDRSGNSVLTWLIRQYAQNQGWPTRVAAHRGDVSADYADASYLFDHVMLWDGLQRWGRARHSADAIGLAQLAWERAQSFVVDGRVLAASGALGQRWSSQGGPFLLKVCARVQRADGVLADACALARPDWIRAALDQPHREAHPQLYAIEGLHELGLVVEAQQALSQSEALYRNLVENSRDGVFLMQHGRVIFANDALGAILDYTSEEMVGASYFDWVCPEDLKAQAERRSQREAGSFETQEYEIHLLRRDGERRLCAVRAGAVEYRGAPASIGTLRDITEVRAQQQRLAAAEERYRLLFQHAVLGMFQSTLDGRMVEVNEAMAQMFGFDSPRAMVREVGNMSQWYVDRNERETLLQKILEEGQIVGREVELYRRNGERFWALTSTRLVRRDDDDPGFLEGSLLDNSARRAAEQELRFLAHHDNLTGLPSRRSFEIELAQALEQSQQDGLARAVLLLDLDRFKLVNDSLGHAAGDDLLVKFSARLSKALAAKAIIARYGGDEFALLTRTAIDENGAEALARAVNQVLASPFQVRGHQVFTGASIGLVLIRGSERKAEDLMRDADTAMFRAKARGGGCHAMFDSHMHSAARERLSLETELRFALERNELEAWFQPMYSLESRRIVGVEALARWRHPRRGMLLPAQFLGVAEDSGMLPSIDLRMLELALRHFAQWQEEFGDSAPARLSVNISDRLFTAPDFARQLADRLRRSHTAPRQVHLEITETVFRGAVGNLHQILSALKQIGVKLVVDDFGTGYSSLVSFSESNFDGLKVDRGFIHDIDSNERHRAIVRTIVQFARDLGLSIVAEGVESETQARLIQELGCDVVQGFLFTPALAPEALRAHLGPSLVGDDRSAEPDAKLGA